MEESLSQSHNYPINEYSNIESLFMLFMNDIILLCRPRKKAFLTDLLFLN